MEETLNDFGDVARWLLGKYREALPILEAIKRNPDDDPEDCAEEIQEILNNAFLYRVGEATALSIVKDAIETIQNYMDSLDHVYGMDDSPNLEDVIIDKVDTYRKNIDKWIFLWMFQAFDDHFRSLYDDTDYFKNNPLYYKDGNGRPRVTTGRETT